MTAEFIPYEQALELKELGFNEHCLAFYSGDGDSKIYYNSLRNGSGDYVPYKASERHKWFGAPLYQQAFRWFREKHQCESSIIAMFLPYEHYKEYQFIITYTESEIVETNFNSYEEAELACLKKLIEIIKNK
jgi:hypothetical protein